MYYAQAQHSAGDFEAASALYSESVLRATEVFGADSHIVGELSGAQASAGTDRGNLAAAVAIAERSLNIYLASAERGSVIHGNRVRLLGTALLAARKLPEAEARLTEAIELTVAAKANLEAAHSRLNLGLALAHLGRFAEAQAVLEKGARQAGQLCVARSASRDEKHGDTAAFAGPASGGAAMARSGHRQCIDSTQPSRRPGARTTRGRPRQTRARRARRRGDIAIARRDAVCRCPAADRRHRR